MTSLTLLHDLHSRYGIHPAGGTVTEVERDEVGIVTVCLDPVGFHLSRRCHRVKLPSEWFTTEAAWAALPKISGQDRRELRTEVLANRVRGQRGRYAKKT